MQKKETFLKDEIFPRYHLISKALKVITVLPDIYQSSEIIPNYILYLLSPTVNSLKSRYSSHFPASHLQKHFNIKNMIIQYIFLKILQQ